ncbi:hypothetical protein FGF1_12970 [Flavobacteriaceae bacterium GF1]
MNFKNREHLIEIDHDKVLDLRKFEDAVKVLLWISADDGKYSWKNEYILNYYEASPLNVWQKNKAEIMISVNHFFAWFGNETINNNALYDYYTQPLVSDKVKEVQINCLLDGIQDWITYNWHFGGSYFYEFEIVNDTTKKLEPLHYLAYQINHNLKIIYDFIWDYLDVFIDKEKRTFKYSCSLKNRPKNRLSTAKESFPIFFKKEQIFQSFLDYTEHVDNNPRSYFGYVFQRMLQESLIHHVSHMQFASFLSEYKLIKPEVYDIISENGGFNSLEKSYSKPREQAYTIYFK